MRSQPQERVKRFAGCGAVLLGTALAASAGPAAVPAAAEAGVTAGTSASVAGTAQPQWSIQHRYPLPMSGASAVSCPARSKCWVVGSGDAAVTSDGGRTWRYQPVPRKLDMLDYTSCASVTHCWAAGTGALMAATTDGGATWHRESLVGSRCGPATPAPPGRPGDWHKASSARSACPVPAPATAWWQAPGRRTRDWWPGPGMAGRPGRPSRYPTVTTPPQAARRSAAAGWPDRPPGSPGP